MWPGRHEFPACADFRRLGTTSGRLQHIQCVECVAGDELRTPWDSDVDSRARGSCIVHGCTITVSVSARVILSDSSRATGACGVRGYEAARMPPSSPTRDRCGHRPVLLLVARSCRNGSPASVQAAGCVGSALTSVFRFRRRPRQDRHPDEAQSPRKKRDAAVSDRLGRR